VVRFILLFAVAIVFATPTMAAETTSATDVVMATCRLQGNGSGAASFLMTIPGPNGKPVQLIVTAAHVLSKMKGESGNLVLRQWDEENSEFIRKPQKLQIREGEKPLWTQHPSHDVAVMTLPKFEGVDIASAPTSCLASDEDFQQMEAGAAIRALGYPHARQFDPSKPGFPLIRAGCVANYPIAPFSNHDTFLADFNTFEGDSGGPIISVASGGSGVKILGLVHGQHFLDLKYDLGYEKGHIRKRLGVSIIINSGVIAETIQLHAKSLETEPEAAAASE